MILTSVRLTLVLAAVASVGVFLSCGGGGTSVAAGAAANFTGLEILPNGLRPAVLEVSYEQQLYVSGTGRDYVFTAEDDLPLGMVLTEQGMIQGAPEEVGVHTFRVAAANRNETVYANFDIFVRSSLPAVPAPFISTIPKLPEATEDTLWQTSNTASGGFPPYTWSFKPRSARPSGLEIEEDGTLVWNDPRVGSHLIDVRVTDSTNATHDARLEVLVRLRPSLRLSVASLPVGVVDRPYSSMLGNISGTSVNWRLVPGSDAPSGMTLSQSGLLTWPNPIAGSYNVQIELTDPSGKSARHTLPLLVDGAYVDLKMTSLTLDLPASSQLYVGDSVTGSVSIRNDGNSSIEEIAPGENASIAIFFDAQRSSNPLPTPSQVIVVPSPALPPGASTTLSFTFENLADGTHSFWAMVDYEDRVQESSESNNDLPATSTIDFEVGVFRFPPYQLTQQVIEEQTTIITPVEDVTNAQLSDIGNSDISGDWLAVTINDRSDYVSPPLSPLTNIGNVYVFRWNPLALDWDLHTSLLGEENDAVHGATRYFGTTLDLDDERLIVSQYDCDEDPLTLETTVHRSIATYEFDNTNDTWTYKGTTTVDETNQAPLEEIDRLGLVLQNDELFVRHVSSHSGGRVSVYDYTQVSISPWVLQATLVPGSNVASFAEASLAVEGNILAVSAPNAPVSTSGGSASLGAVVVFRKMSGQWQEDQLIRAEIYDASLDGGNHEVDFGTSIAIADGQLSVSTSVAASSAGVVDPAIFVYDDDGSRFALSASLVATPGSAFASAGGPIRMSTQAIADKHLNTVNHLDTTTSNNNDGLFGLYLYRGNRWYYQAYAGIANDWPLNGSGGLALSSRFVVVIGQYATAGQNTYPSLYTLTR